MFQFGPGGKPMILLILAVVAFGILHVVPVLPAVRANLLAKLGRAFGPVYGLTSLLVLVLAVWAFRHADRAQVYTVPDWGRYADFLLTLIGFVFLGIFLFRGSWRGLVRHPMAIAVLFWGAGHLLTNGDSGSLVFFGGLMAAALVHAILVPAKPSDVRGGHNLMSVLFGVALYAVTAQAHGALIGVPVFTLPV
jgi:uncharacterized membrane protein